jgi:hypothetical protein
MQGFRQFADFDGKRGKRVVAGDRRRRLRRIYHERCRHAPLEVFAHELLQREIKRFKSTTEAGAIVLPPRGFKAKSHQVWPGAAR